MGSPSEEELRRIYAETERIAVVGASTDPEKAAHEIPRYLHSQGYRILPVSPKGGELFDEPVAPSLEEVEPPVDVVDVFRPPNEAVAVARAAVALRPKVLWFQPGTDSEEAVRAAEEAGVTVITDLCMGATHGQLGLGPGPWKKR
jgi:uncharacterized protein